MGSAILSLMVFVGIMLILRAVLFGVIPYLQKRNKDRNDFLKKNHFEEKERD